MKLTTTIDQHHGNHHTGMRITALVDVVTDEEGDDDWIARLHAARVEFASLDCYQRAIAIRWLSDHDSDGIDEIEAYRSAIDHAKAVAK